MENDGIIQLRSAHGVRQTLDRLEARVRERGGTIFGRIDQAAAAAAVGLEMRPTELLIFGDPKAGTPLMVRFPALALDLPLKALAWEDADGTTWLSYNAFEYLAERHHLDAVPFKPAEALFRSATAPEN